MRWGVESGRVTLIGCLILTMNLITFPCDVINVTKEKRISLFFNASTYQPNTKNSSNNYLSPPPQKKFNCFRFTLIAHDALFVCTCHKHKWRSMRHFIPSAQWVTLTISMWNGSKKLKKRETRSQIEKERERQIGNIKNGNLGSKIDLGWIC